MNALKRYHNWLAVPAIVIIIFCLFSGFSSDKDFYSAEEQLLERTEIMRSCLDGEIGYAEAEKRLSRIETQPLLSEDMNNLRSAVDTDFDRVNKMYIISMENKRDILGSRTYEAFVKWDMEGAGGRYVAEGTYSIIEQKVGEKYLLSKFEVIL